MNYGNRYDPMDPELKGKFGIDTKVLDYIMQKNRPSEEQIQAEEDRDEYQGNRRLLAGLADASAAMGSIGGQKADTSSVHNYVKQAEAGDMQRQKMDMVEDDRQQKVRNFLAERYLKKQDSAAAQTQKIAYDDSKRKKDLASKKELADYNADIAVNKEKEKRKIKKGWYDNQGNDLLGGVPGKEDQLFSQMLSSADIGMAEKKAIKQVAYRYQTLRANVNQMKKLIEEKGTFEATGPHNERLDALLYEVAIDYAKLVDPESVAREGEVIAAQKYLLKIRPAFGLGMRNQTAVQLLDDQLNKLDVRLNAKLQQEGMANVDVIKTLADNADKLYKETDLGYPPEGAMDTAYAAEPQQAPQGMVYMVAPDGGLLQVPADQVEQLEAAGAKRK